MIPVATWVEVQQQIATALGTTPDKLPRRDSHEWYALIGGLETSHPELVELARSAMVTSATPEPLPTQAEISSARRRAGALSWLIKWTQRPDPTQPPRQRTNRSVVLLVIAIGFVAMWMAFRAHNPAPAHPAAQYHPTQQTATTPTSSGSSLGGGPSTTAPTQTGPASTATRPAGPSPTLPAVAQPPLPPYPGASGQSGGGTTVASGASQQSAGLQVVAPQESQGALTVVSGTASAEAGGAAGGQQNSGLQVVTAQAQQGGPGDGAGGSSGQEGAPTDAAKGPTFQVGDTFTVKLITPMAVSPAWQAMPAVAQGIDGPLSGWRILGSTSLGQDGSIQISWTQALAPDGKTTVALHGVAYDPQLGKPGIPHAQTQVMAPNSARTVLSGTLGAVSQYVQDQIQSQSAIIGNGTTLLTSNVPPFWQIAAQQLATGFQPAQVQTGGTIVVARVPAGTTVVVFITAP